MAAARLTKAVKEDIARASTRALFEASLREYWKIVEEQFTSLSKEIFKDFDWEHVAPYRTYMDWDTAVQLSGLPAEWQVHWDTVRAFLKLPSIDRIQINFEYPSRGNAFLDSAYRKQAEGILRPYMIKYFAARKYFEDVRQILIGITTYKQLEESVPELMQYVPNAEVMTVTSLVPIEQINRVRALLQKEDK
jgi:hypothetical protein